MKSGLLAPVFPWCDGVGKLVSSTLGSGFLLLTGGDLLQQGLEMSSQGYHMFGRSCPEDQAVSRISEAWFKLWPLQP